MICTLPIKVEIATYPSPSLTFKICLFGGPVFYWCCFDCKKSSIIHCGIPCKITDPTDKNCGNERKIRLTSKNSLFYAPIFTFQINDQKTREFKQLLGHPPTIFLCRIRLATHEQKNETIPSPKWPIYRRYKFILEPYTNWNWNWFSDKCCARRCQICLAHTLMVYQEFALYPLSSSKYFPKICLMKKNQDWLDRYLSLL